MSNNQQSWTALQMTKDKAVWEQTNKIFFENYYTQKIKNALVAKRGTRRWPWPFMEAFIIWYPRGAIVAPVLFDGARMAPKKEPFTP